MAGNSFGGGGDKFRAASQNLARPIMQLGSPQVMQMPIGKDLRGNVAVNTPTPDVAPAVIGKGAQGVNGTVPLRVVGHSPFGHEMGAPGPMPMPMPQHQPAMAPPQQQPPQSHPGLGANEEVHVLVATLEGPDKRTYEAVYEVVAPRGSTVLGVSERAR